MNAQSVRPPQHLALNHNGRRKNGSSGPPQQEPEDPPGDQDAEYAHRVQASWRGDDGTHLSLVERAEFTARCPQRGHTA
ncbi:hypothetical protein [Micromonospora psammae]|uniref:hypothetical protein n=1 Tax=Micromonospora sp. CPCC 205556 TaxID=3122398 RepID=UPI002FF08200